VNAPHDRAWLAAHLPHQGVMNLLDGVVAWDEATLQATATSHRSPANPLRRGAELPATAAIEYGAQAAAAHGALAAGAPSAAGMIASVRGVRMSVRRLDDVASALEVRVEQVGGGPGGVVYAFAVLGDGRVLVEGRVTVAFAR